MTCMPWTTSDIPDLSGRRAVVTGANSGLGLELARELARHGAEVVLGCRNLSKGEEALAQVRSAATGPDPELGRLDLADLHSVAEFAAAHADPGGIDLLVNNAGIMAPPRGVTADGFEAQLGTNHLGHFALTGRLLPALLRRPRPRVVTVSSAAHRMGRIDFDDLHGQRRYRRYRAYGQSKLANLLFAFELDRRARAAGTALVSVAAHPGYAATNIQTASTPAREALFMRLLNRLVAQSAGMGALPLLFAATVEDLPGGTYIGPDGPAEARGHPRPVSPSPQAEDAEVARRLWEVSEALTGVSFDFGVRTTP
jgi:NAD(P)-dependent dehydrogenase (short-subunit alcohol dehydrogenase family)